LDAEQRKLRGIMRHGPSGPPAVVLGGVGLLCCAATVLVTETVPRTSILACGLALILLALIYARRAQNDAVKSRLARRQRSILTQAVTTLVTHDTDPTFLTDTDGEIQFANPAAKEVFGEAAETDLTTALSQVLANPDNVLFRLQNRGITIGAAKEDVLTRTGQYRLSVVKTGEDTQLWRFEQTSETAREVGRASDSLSLPMMTVGPSNAVLYVNEAMRKLAGIRPKSVTDVFAAQRDLRFAR